MKKLFVTLFVVVLASLLLAGCIPTTPAEGETEGEGEAETVASAWSHCIGNLSSHPRHQELYQTWHTDGHRSISRFHRTGIALCG